MKPEPLPLDVFPGGVCWAICAEGEADLPPEPTKRPGGPMLSTPAGLAHPGNLSEPEPGLGPHLMGVSLPDTGVRDPKRLCCDGVPLPSPLPPDEVCGLGTGKRLSPGVDGNDGVSGVPESRPCSPSIPLSNLRTSTTITGCTVVQFLGQNSISQFCRLLKGIFHISSREKTSVS